MVHFTLDYSAFALRPLQSMIYREYLGQPILTWRAKEDFCIFGFKINKCIMAITKIIGKLHNEQEIFNCTLTLMQKHNVSYIFNFSINSSAKQSVEHTGKQCTSTAFQKVPCIYFESKKNIKLLKYLILLARFCFFWR